jgi:hypothetical protein
MKVEPQPYKKKICSETKRVFRDFIRVAVSYYNEILVNKAPEWEPYSWWVTSEMGQYQKITTMKRKVPGIRTNFVESLAGYKDCVTQMEADLIIGPHLNKLVGGEMGGQSLITASGLMWRTIYEMFNDQGAFTFTDETFEREWRSQEKFFCSDTIEYTIMAPVPNLVLEKFPLCINNEITIDRFTSEEAGRCCDIGLFSSLLRSSDIIPAEYAVGIRLKIVFQKVVTNGNEKSGHEGNQDKGSFGNRSKNYKWLLIDDVISALRLFKDTQVYTGGYGMWAEGFYFNSGYSASPKDNIFTSYNLCEDEVPKFLEFWDIMMKKAAPFEFSINRFNLAFERDSYEDQVIDLTIVVESLLLGSGDKQELSYRSALRLAKFISHEDYSEKQIYKFMRAAYSIRSSIVHGNKIDKKIIILPDGTKTELHTHLLMIRQLVWLVLRKVLSMEDGKTKLSKADYWDDLILASPNS